MRDDTGVIFASAFPGLNAFVDELNRYHQDHSRRDALAMLEGLRARAQSNGHTGVVQEIERLTEELRIALKSEPYLFDRRFLFKVLAMGHSQFAEIIGARGPNTQINAACASTTQGVALAQDWIRTGRCRRVIVITADDVTSDSLMDWMGAGFLATGAAATDESVESAAIPFDRRRHGMILGMGAAALVVESAEAARERGLQPICEVLSTVVANSAFHGTRLDVQHIGNVMESLVTQAERHGGFSRHQAAPQMVFVSHETYTPARGGSASAEINALRRVFADVADKIVIANTKGFTGHAMAAGIEDVVAVKALETGCVPPVANFREIDPELGARGEELGASDVPAVRPRDERHVVHLRRRRGRAPDAVRDDVAPRPRHLPLRGGEQRVVGLVPQRPAVERGVAPLALSRRRVRRLDVHGRLQPVDDVDVVVAVVPPGVRAHLRAHPGDRPEEARDDH
jgi:hypothetical protein